MIKRNDAVSPVIGILLMLVITIIIAAVLSGFVSNFVQGQQKVPQAQITAKFSILDGFTIKHDGGDPIATRDAVITIRNSRIFGPDVEHRSVAVLNSSKMFNNDGVAWFNDVDGTIGVTAFSAGETVWISPTDCNCDVLQPIVAPGGNAAQRYITTTNPMDNVGPDGFTYTGPRITFWALCFRNNDNIGKAFIMDVSDRATGKIISSAYVTITA